MNEKKRVLLPVSDAEKLLAYLQGQPYREVAQLVAAIVGAQVAEVQPLPPKSEPPRD